MQALKEFAGLEKPKPKSFLEELEAQYCTLSYSSRIIAFLVAFVLGAAFCFLSTSFLVMPRTFAKYYTLGSLLIFSSTFFLMGPTAQLRSMLAPNRACASVTYVLSMAATLYCALSLQRIGLSIVMIGVQMCALVWYAASYIYFAQDCLKGTAKSVLPI